jgi:D-alanyl-D-alanine carboxypeptidase (penicillin-binding protein 5/6)
MPIKRYQTGTHPYHTYRDRHGNIQRLRNKRRKWILPLTLLALFFISGSSWLIWRFMTYVPPQPSVSVTSVAAQSQNPVGIPWPSAPSAIGTTEEGVIDQNNARQTPQPSASTAKLITVLVVLQKYPLGLTEQGPFVTMTEEDMQRYNRYYSEGGSTIAVQRGQQISQRQLIEGTLLPSANNYADSLAVWAFGSLEKYREAAQKYVRAVGATKTTIGSDASGFDPSTKSTAHDLVLIGIAAATQPLVRTVMAKKTTELPIIGKKDSTNWLLGTNGFIGGKTGNTDQAGGVFVGVAEKQITAQKKITIVTAVQGETSVNQAMSKTDDLMIFITPLFKEESIVKKGDVIGSVKTAWGTTADIVSKYSIKKVVWNNTSKKPRIMIRLLNPPIASDATVGTLIYDTERINLVTTRPIDTPPLSWKLMHFLR